MNHADKLLSEVGNLSDLLLAAETTAGKALELMAVLRKQHRAKVEEWQKARGITDDPTDTVRERVNSDDAEGAVSLLNTVSGAIKRAENASETRIEAPSVEERPGRESKISSTEPAPGGTIEGREDGATRPPADLSRNESGPRSSGDGRSDA